MMLMKKMGLAVLSFVMSACFIGLVPDTAQAVTKVWRQMVGVTQPANVVGSGTGAVTGGGQPWTTTETFLPDGAVVNLGTGFVRFRVAGLVLAGGNNVGNTDAVTSVTGAIVCDTDGSAGAGNSVVVETPPVPLAANGNAAFSGTLTLPAVCSAEQDIAFLIRIAGGGPWIANGAVLITRP